jgi:hypothetical protein
LQDQDQDQEQQQQQGVLKLTGFVRGIALSANQLITLPGVSPRHAPKPSFST